MVHNALLRRLDSVRFAGGPPNLRKEKMLISTEEAVTRALKKFLNPSYPFYTTKDGKVGIHYEYEAGANDYQISKKRTCSSDGAER